MDIECLVKSCKGCALATKAPPIKFNPETDHPWSHLHVHFAGPLNGTYYLIVIVFRSDIFRCNKPTTQVVIQFLHKQFMNWFIVPDSIMSDNITQFTSKELNEFCKMFVV